MVCIWSPSITSINAVPPPAPKYRYKCIRFEYYAGKRIIFKEIRIRYSYVPIYVPIYCCEAEDLVIRCSASQKRHFGIFCNTSIRNYDKMN